ncbi:AtpZ/AtpI family protein [Wocania ichthyoenteri]|uniref:AtpZ/AtpI family protein n=1 Tax=Wocania ichthyoenteri TaxID=1230531 RepID=UPI0012E09FF9|nr:AtpZ/AtpI family protein [Wocania ichthyoenteri]
MDNNNQKHSQKPKRQLNTYARFSGLAIQMFAIIGVGTFIGYKLDENYPNKHSLFTLFGALSSVIISIIYIIRRIIATSKEEQ